MLKDNKGITLIALVITIIVLLILAGVSIAMLTGNNGILSQATNAGDATSVAEVVERVNMELQAQYANALAGDPFDTDTTIKTNIGTVDGYTIDVAVVQTEDDTTGSVTITVKDAEGTANSGDFNPAVGEVKYVTTTTGSEPDTTSTSEWTLIPIKAAK